MQSLTIPPPASCTVNIICSQNHLLWKILTFTDGAENITLNKAKELAFSCLSGFSSLKFLDLVRFSLSEKLCLKLNSYLLPFITDPRRPSIDEIKAAFTSFGINFEKDNIGFIKSALAPSLEDIKITTEAIKRGLIRPKLTFKPFAFTEKSYLSEFQCFLKSIKNPDGRLEIVLTRFNSNLKALPNVRALQGVTTIKLKNLKVVKEINLTGLAITEIFIFNTSVQRVILGSAKKTLRSITLKRNLHLETLPDFRKVMYLSRLNLIECVVINKECRVYAINTSSKNEIGPLLQKLYPKKS